MKPINFKEVNITFAENQPEYLPLPAYKANDGQVVVCWNLTARERVKLLFTGRFWLRMLTFNKPLQPLSPTVDYPFKEK